jgi:hypothetical protein
MAQDWDQWRALLYTVKSIGFHKILVNYWVNEREASSQEGLS